jgi:hypothetical protein
MDPFSILGVSRDASDDQIRAAYRRLVKQHHPDRNPSADQEQIRAINWAYETLTDPEKRARYHQPSTTILEEVYQEDPAEVYKREFKWKRWQREKQEQEETAAHEADVIRVMRLVNIPILVFAILLTIDRLLPTVIYEEQMLEATKESRTGKRTSDEYSFIRTAHFSMNFNKNMYVYFDSFAADTIMVKVELSPIFKVPRRASYFYDNAISSGDVVNTMHDRSFLITNIILFCVANFLYRKTSSTTYAFCFLPSFFFILFLWSNLID